MTTAIPVHVALVDKTGKLDAAELAAVSGALNEQVQADFAPVWHVRATVGYWPSAPAGNPDTTRTNTWQIVIEKDLDQPGALGYHTDELNQPVSYVEYTSDWSVTVSHECLEMLADPFGNRLHAARLPQGLEDYEKFGLAHVSSRVHYLLEVGDPCEATSYEVGGVDLSDFLLPAWYRTSKLNVGGAYSRAGGCSEPREVADGGYVSFSNGAGEWFQVFNQGGDLQVSDLGKFDRADHGSLREFVDQAARETRADSSS
jgi:hypothetical protein